MNKLKKREELSGTFLPKIMSPSTELHSCSSSSCASLPFLSQLRTQRECSPHRLKGIQSHDLCFPSRRCAPPICPREMLDVQLLTRVFCCSLRLSGEEHGGSPQRNAPCSRSTATEACNLFTVTYSLREGTPANTAETESPASLEEHASHLLWLIFWGWEYPKGTLRSCPTIGWTLCQ